MFKRFLIISAAGAAVFLLYCWLLQYPGLGLPQVNLLFWADDIYMDFFNMLFIAKNLDVYTKHLATSSPVFLLFCNMINKIFPALGALQDSFNGRNLFAGMATFAAFTFVALSLFAMAFNGLFKKFNVPGKYRFWFYLIFIFSYPVVFAIDRGNYVLFAGALMALFLLQYINGKTLFAALLLACAISLKYYLAVFGVLFIFDRKWRDACVTALLTAFLLGASLAFFDGGLPVNLNQLCSNVMLYNTVGHTDSIKELLGFNTSIYSLFGAPYCSANEIFGGSSALLAPLNGKIKYLAHAILLLVVSLGFVPKIKLHDKVLLLTAGMLLFPLMSGDYIIPMFFFPAVYWILSEPDDRVMPWLAGLYVICKRYIPLCDYGDSASVTIQAVLNPLILLVVIGYIVWMRMRIIDSLRKMMESPGLRKWLAYAQPFILAVVTFVVAARFAGIGVDAHHDGLMFKPALDVAEGKMLFRDTFTQYGAFTTLLQALALKIFGHYLLVIKLQAAFFYALSVYFLWLIWKRFIPKWLATICGLIYVCMAACYFDYAWLLTWSPVYSLFFLVLSLYLIILFIEKRTGYYLLATGASVALTLWCRQPVGVFLFCALSVFLVCLSLFENFPRNKFRYRNLNVVAGGDDPGPASTRPATVVSCRRPNLYHQAALFLAGFLSVNALFIAWLLFNHAFKNMYLQLLVFPSGSCHGFISYSSYVWAALPVVCLILFFRTVANYFWRKSFDEKQAIMFAVVLVCLFSCMQYYPVPSLPNVYWAFPPMIGVFAYFVWDLFKNENAIFRGVVVLLVMGLLFQADIADRIRGGRISLYKEYITLSYPKVLKGMRVTPKEAVNLQAIASDIDDYFQQRPEGGLINLTDDALYPAFVENLRNVHPLHVYWSGFEVLYPNYFRSLREYAENRRAIIISRNKPMLYVGYTVKSLCRDIYITAPADTNNAWRVAAVRVAARELAAPTKTVERDYWLDMQCAATTAPATIRSIAAAAYDFNGAFMGVWYPFEQTSNSITLNFEKTPASGPPQPLNHEFSIPPSGKYQLCLAGHDATNDMRVKIVTTMSDGPRSRQIISILPPPDSPGQSGFDPLKLISLSKNIRQSVKDAVQLVPENARIYLIWQGTDNYHYFALALAYELASCVVNREAWSLGDPCFEGDAWTRSMSPETWSDILNEGQYDFVVIGQADEKFWNKYGKLFEDPEANRGNNVFKVIRSPDRMVQLCPVRINRREGTIMPGKTRSVSGCPDAPSWLALNNPRSLCATSGCVKLSTPDATWIIPGRVFRANSELTLCRNGQFRVEKAVSGGERCLRNSEDKRGWRLGYRDIAWNQDRAGLLFRFAAPGPINYGKISVQMRNYMDTSDVAARIGVSLDNGRTYRELPEKKTGFLATNLLVWSSIVDANTNKEVWVKVSAPLQNMYVGIDGIQAVFSGSMSAQLWATNDPPLEIKNETPFPLELKKGGFADGQEDWWESFFR